MTTPEYRPRLVTWTEKQLAHSLDNLLNELIPDAETRRIWTDGLAAGLIAPMGAVDLGAVRIVSTVDNPDLLEQMAKAMWETGQRARFRVPWESAQTDIKAEWLAAAGAALEVVYPT